MHQKLVCRMVLFTIYTKNINKNMNALFVILIATCPLFILIGWLMLKFPPKSINMWYGYRTKQSKSTTDKWKFSQPYAAIQLIKSGLLGSCLSIPAMFIDLSEGIAVVIGLGVILMLVIYPYYKTEKAMRQKFGK